MVWEASIFWLFCFGLCSVRKHVFIFIGVTDTLTSLEPQGRNGSTVPEALLRTHTSELDWKDTFCHASICLMHQVALGISPEAGSAEVFLKDSHSEVTEMLQLISGPQSNSQSVTLVIKFGSVDWVSLDSRGGEKKKVSAGIFKII